MLYLAVFRLFTDLITNSTRLQTQIMTPAYMSLTSRVPVSRFARVDIDIDNLYL